MDQGHIRILDIMGKFSGKKSRKRGVGFGAAYKTSPSERMKRFRGRKGGGKGGASDFRSPIEKPNTLQSVATARIIDLLCEGPIGGLVEGLKSVFFDDTPVQNEDGSFNFDGVTLQMRNGLSQQSPMDGFSEVESETIIALEATDELPVSRRLTNSDIDAIRIKVRLPQLLEQISDANAANFGDVVQTSVTFRLQISTNEAGYVDLPGSPFTITGKTTSPYERQYEFVLPAGGPPWDVRLLRVTPDSEVQSLQNRTFLGTITEITYAKILYSNSAVAGLSVDTRQLDRVPARAYEIIPLLMRIPSNYNPETHVYDPEIWDLTFKTDATENPAWVLYEIVTNNRFGLGQEVPPEFLDKVMMYEIGRYCDERVPSSRTPYTSSLLTNVNIGPNYDVSIDIGPHEFEDGDYVIVKGCVVEEINGLHQISFAGNYHIILEGITTQSIVDLNPNIRVYATEPRFTCNANFNTKQSAYSLIAALCSCMRSQPYWSSGGIAISQDAPKDPSKIVSRSNTIDGDFTYSSPELSERFSVVKVTWSDPVDGYKPAVEYVEDASLIRRFGVRTTEVYAVGATSRSQARRHGMWILLTGKHCSQVISYRCGLDQANLCPGEIISVNDPTEAGVRHAGQIVALDDPGAAAIVTIDQGININTDETYTLSVAMQDGTVETRDVTNAVGDDQTEISVSPPFSAVGILTGAQWGVSASDVVLRKFRVVKATEYKPHQFEITAVAHEPSIYDNIDFGVGLDLDDTSTLPTGLILQPSNLTAREYLWADAVSVYASAVFSWTPPLDPRVTMYELQVMRPGSSAWESYDGIDGITQSVSAILENVIPGLHLVRIRARDNFGRSSMWFPAVDGKEFVFLGLLAPPGDVQNLRSILSFQRLSLTWDRVTDLDLKNYELRYSPLLVGATWAGAQPMFTDIGKERTSIDVPLVSGTYMMKAVDTSLVQSMNATSVIVDSIGSIGLNLVETIQEDPDWLGTHDGTVVSGSLLQLDGDGGSFMAEWTSLAEVISLATGVGAFVPIGYYYFLNEIDLGARFDVRVTSEIHTTGLNIYNVMAAWDSLADLVNMAGFVEGEAWVDLLISTTDDDPGGTPTWTPYQSLIGADIRCRALRFALRLTTTKPFITPQVETAIITVDMYDRIIQGVDVEATGGTKTIVFNPAYKSTRPALVVSLQDMQQGDYHTITAGPNENGFSLEIRDAGNSLVTRSFDFVSRGWGSVLD